MNSCKLSILMPSYNKGRYIEEALESILMQETDYEYQIIIADDCSTDNTIDIVKSYQDKYSNKIVFLESDKNQGLYKNILRAYQITKTDYFCVLDPDDYWIAANFIQSALDFLEKNVEYTTYAANAYKLKNESRCPYINVNKPTSYDFRDFLDGRAVLGWTGATIFRNVIFKNGVPEKMLHLENPTCKDSFRGDSFRNLIHLKEGKSYFSADYMAVYRISNDGIWQGSSTIKKNLLNAQFFINLDKYYDGKYPELVLMAYRIFLNMKIFNEIADEKIFNQFFELKHYFKARKGIINSMLSVKSKLKYFIKDLKQAIKIRVLKSININLINKKISNAKYVHIMFNDKFNKPFVSFLNRNFNQEEHIVLCKRWFNEHEFPQGKNVFEIKRLKGLKLPKSDKIICHSLFDVELVEYLYNNKNLLNKAYWVIWGGDLYNAKRDKINDYVRQNFKGYIGESEKKTLFERYGIAATFYKPYYTFPISPSVLNHIKVSRHDYIKIQINNSCDDSTLEMLDILFKFKDKNIKITTILSYGKLEYKQRIINKGKELFGDRFEYIDKYLPSGEYASYLSENDILILNQNRQQGFGNVVASLYLGKKVYIKSDISLYEYFKNNGVKIYNTNDICSMEFDEFIANNSSVQNQNGVLKFFDEKYLAKLWGEFFDA